jgi:hypothetical protein
MAEQVPEHSYGPDVLALNATVHWAFLTRTSQQHPAAALAS